MLGKLIVLEWKQMLRSRWLQLVAVLFIFVFVSIVMIQQLALPDIEGFTRQTASFLNLLLFLLPLFTLTIGGMSVAGDVESGWFSLLKTYPMKIFQYVSGKFVALVGSFIFIVLLALGVVFLLGGLFGGVKVPYEFLVIALCLIFIFSAIAILLGTLAKNRLHALAISLVVWALLLLLLSYLVMAIGTVVPGHVLQKLTIAILHINPVDWLRFGYFLISGQTAVLGPTYYDLIGFYGSVAGKAVFIVVTILWIVVPLFLATIKLKKFGVEK
ncbi:ABC transporter permease subunit [Ureibacillus sp. FSL K6-8385]|uniref:ABC transporter permease subunit n=1 Tax=Ureibacillus terrenus TaxID=118246 RepID=A0A540V3R8_9BACL|nr:ABC transporter permease subunit [Ureibacillus terrenus]MED3661817.1 ABC transporter permease subunit [Ureibacillus terrenus]MED3763120.1 ABC transporter permease subunit [Ureibacillus terrenus]TQE91371.1 ABC transporter permease subunit [Ureibacillus terrenus]